MVWINCMIFFFFSADSSSFTADSEEYTLGTDLIHNTNKESKFLQVSPGVVI